MLVDGLIVRLDELEQVYVPALHRKTIIKLNHDFEYAGHLGIDKTTDLVSRNFFGLRCGKTLVVIAKLVKSALPKRMEDIKNTGLRFVYQ